MAISRCRRDAECCGNLRCRPTREIAKVGRIGPEACPASHDQVASQGRRSSEGTSRKPRVSETPSSELVSIRTRTKCATPSAASHSRVYLAAFAADGRVSENPLSISFRADVCVRCDRATHAHSPVRRRSAGVGAALSPMRSREPSDGWLSAQRVFRARRLSTVTSAAALRY